VPSDERLKERNLDRESVRKYGIRWAKEKQAWVIPIVSAMGELFGWQLKAKNFVRNYPLGVKKSFTLFGIDQINSDTCVLVESPLDVVRINTALDGVCGLATFGAHISDTQVRLISTHVNRLIIAMDNDDAGKSATKKLSSRLPALRYPVTYLQYNHTTAKDIGDMTDNEVYEAVKNCSVFPTWVPRV
jgi:5S rRNA maturation endonuclease (ribonuclease M5)